MEILFIIAAIWLLAAALAGALEQAPRTPLNPPHKRKGK